MATQLSVVTTERAAPVIEAALLDRITAMLAVTAGQADRAAVFPAANFDFLARDCPKPGRSATAVHDKMKGSFPTLTISR